MADQGGRPHNHHHHHHHHRIECAALFSYAGNSESISIACGEIVHAKIDPLKAEDGWIYIEKENGTNGFVPATYVEPTVNGLWIVGRVLYDYEGLSEGTVSVKREQIILVNTSTLEKDWIAIKRPECKGGTKGHVPSTYVEIISKFRNKTAKVSTHKKQLKHHEKTKIFRRRSVETSRAINSNSYTNSSTPVTHIPEDGNLLTCKAMYDFDLSTVDESYLNNPNEPDLISLVAGERVQTTNKEFQKSSESWIFVTKLNSGRGHEEGFVPRAYLENITINKNDDNLKIDSQSIASVHGEEKGTSNDSNSNVKKRTLTKRPSKNVLDILSENEEARSEYRKNSFISSSRSSSIASVSSRVSSIANRKSRSSTLSSRPSAYSAISERPRRSRRFSTDSDAVNNEKVYRYVNSKRRRSRFARKTTVHSIVFNDAVIKEANAVRLDKWYSPKVGRKVEVIINRAKNEKASGIVKKVQIENTFKVEFDKDCVIDKQIVKELENVSRENIISSKWARMSGNVPPSFLSCMSGGGAGGADRPVRTVRDVPFVSALARSAKELGIEVPDFDLQGIFQGFSYQRFKPGQILFSEGSSGEKLYIILTGEVSIRTSGKEINTLSSGDWFGEIALLQRSSRTADCVSIGHSCLLVMHKDKFKQLEKEYEWLRKAMSALTNQRTGKLLRQVPFFKDLSSQQLKRLGDVFVYKSYDAGRVIFNEGDKGENFYILVHGKCSISIKRGDTTTIIKTLEAISHFGEIALVEKCSRTASVVTASDVTLLVLSASKFESFMRHAPSTLLRGIRQHIDYALSGMVRKIPFFKDIKDVGVLASMFHLKTLDKGAVVCREGDQGTAFYIIIEGECLVTAMNDAKETRLLATLKKNDYFGEIALLRQLKRTATITCNTRCRFLVLASSEFTRFLSIAPELKQTLNEHVKNISKELSEGSPGYIDNSRGGSTFIGVDVDALCGLGELKADVAFKHSVEWREAPLLYDIQSNDNVFTDFLPDNILNPKRLFINSFVNEEYYKQWSQSGIGSKIEVFTARIFFSPSLFPGASNLASIETKFYLHRTVEKAIDKISSEVSSKWMQHKVPLSDFKTYGLKTLNRSEYLVERDRIIGHYSCIQQALRNDFTIEFVLVVIPEAQLKDEQLHEEEDAGDILNNESELTLGIDNTAKNTNSFGNMKNKLVVYTSMVIEDFYGVNFNLPGSRKTYNCLNLREGSVILTVFPDKSHLPDNNKEGKWCGGIIGGRIGLIPCKCVELLYETPLEEYNVESYMQHVGISRKRTNLNKQNSKSFGSRKVNRGNTRRKSSYHISSASEFLRNNLDLTDDYMMNAGLHIPKAHGFKTALREIKFDNHELLFANGWIDAVHTGVTHVVRQISGRDIAHDSRAGESGSSDGHTNAKTLSIPYRLRLNLLKNMKLLINQSELSVEYESNRKSFEADGTVMILIEIVEGGLTLSSCTYRFSGEDLRELNLAEDCHIMSPWLYFGHGVKQEGIEIAMNSPRRGGRTTDQINNTSQYLEILNIPLSARLCFTLKYISTNIKSEKIPTLWEQGALLGGATMSIFSFKRLLKSGKQYLVVNPSKLPERKMAVKGIPENDSVTLEVEFDKFAKHVIHNFPPRLQRYGGRKNTQTIIDRANLANIPKKVLAGFEKTANFVFDAGPSHIFTIDEKSQIWAYRYHLMAQPRALPFMLLSVDKTNPKQLEEMYSLLRDWKRPSPVCAMELLDYRFGDYRVRQYAVRMMEQLSDNELSDCMLQLVQVLKFEPYNRSPLAFFLLRRALQNPQLIGHKLFWFLRSEMGTGTQKNERYASLLLAYLQRSPVHVQQLTLQSDMNQFLENAVSDIIHASQRMSGDKLQEFARSLLEELVNKKLLDGKSILCLGSEWQTKRLIIDKCKVMNSKQKPLWLVFENGEGTKGTKPIYAMYKSGDDLRQDQITLQLLRFMDRLWITNETEDEPRKPDPLDLKLTPYGCISTGVDMGMLEIVTESNTTANIQKVLGSMGAFRNKSLLAWLKDKNPDELDENQNFKKKSFVVDNFVRSCAGYCVASYVLGLGDRHADNIMLKENGKLFHIDFGHFLGNFKTKLGFKRERTPFVFTPEMAEVIKGGEQDDKYLEFINYCGRAYNILRKNATSLIIMMRLMIPAGMPELQNESDIEYLVDKLQLKLNDKEAAVLMTKEIKKCLSDTYRRIDNFIHNVKTGL